LGDQDGALADFDEAIRLDPDNPAGYNLRAAAHYLRGDVVAALADHERALERAADDPATLNYLAWVLATSPEEALIDGPRAVGYAERACELTDWAKAGVLDTLAAAYAAAGRFEDAVRVARDAVAKAPDDGRGEYERRLALYEAGRAYRE